MRKTWHRRSQLRLHRVRCPEANREEDKCRETRKRRTEPDSDIGLFSSGLEPAFRCATLAHGMQDYSRGKYHIGKNMRKEF